MSLTTGRGPLSPDPAGRFNPPLAAGRVYVEPFPRRVRAVRDGRLLVDSERALLVHRPGRPPTYAFPKGDVEGGGGDPEPEAPDHVQLAWDAAEHWYEEDEEVFGHPRNPYHRVECVRTSRRLHIACLGQVLVDTRKTVGVYETALEPRLYVARDEVRAGSLRPSPTTTYCPYKGTARYWSVVVDDALVTDAAWSYEDPLPESGPIRGMLAFDETKVDVTHDLPRLTAGPARKDP